MKRITALLIAIMLLMTAIPALAETDAPAASPTAAPEVTLPASTPEPEPTPEVIAEPEPTPEPTPEVTASPLPEPTVQPTPEATEEPQPTFPPGVDTSRLERIWFKNAPMRPVMQEGLFEYNVYYPTGTEVFVFKPYFVDENADIEIFYEGVRLPDEVVATRRIELKPKSQYTFLKLSIRSGQYSSDYTFQLIRGGVAMSQIKGLELEGIELSPEFHRATYSYTAENTVPYDVDSTSVTTFRLANKYSSYRVRSNGAYCDMDDIPLKPGENTIKISVKSVLGVTSVYTIKVYRDDFAGDLTPFEVSLIETSFRLLPERHPFKLAWEETYGRKINTYTATKKGIKVSGVPFEFGGSGSIDGFSSRWWNKTGVSQYPAGGLDCAEFIHWVYRQMGYETKSNSASLFLSGKVGEERKISGVKTHLVIPLDEIKIGDIAYNSKDFSYRSGHGSHSVIYIGTANQLGIADALKKYYPDFPMDAMLTIDTGWADGDYYYKLMKKLGISGRSSMCGVGIQFFTSIKQGGKYLYKSPYLSNKKQYSWKDPKSGSTFTVRAGLEQNGRLLQAKSSMTGLDNIANISRPVVP